MKEYKQILLLVVFLGVVLALLSALSSEATTVVEISPEGFAPCEVYVREGDTIIFKNVGADEHWVASDTHPTHADYPGSDIRSCNTVHASRVFDSCASIQQGEVYRFQFNESGEWGMHDHLNPKLTGTVHVSDVSWRFPLFDSVFSFLSMVIKHVEDFFSSVVPKDYEKVDVASVLKSDSDVRRMISQLGLPRTVEKVATEVIYTDAARECHLAMHIVGRQAFELFGAEAFEQCSAVCFSGCYHGVIERLGAAGGGEEMFNQIRTVCSAQETVFERDQCFHGAGHGFLIYAEYNLMSAMDACGRMDTGLPQRSCYSGVFMEGLEGDGAGMGGGVSLRSYENLHYPCNVFHGNPDAEQACYRLWPSHFLNVYGEDYTKASEECMRAPSSARGTCFLRLGQTAGAHMEFPAEKTESFCATVPDMYYGDCIKGGLRQAVIFPGPDSMGSPVSFCKSLSSVQAKNVCYSEYSQNLKDMFTDTDTRLQICELFEVPYQEVCRKAQ